jgi:membrane associated rhomboid family serine protease
VPARESAVPARESAVPARESAVPGWRTAPVTYGLLALYVAVFVVESVSSGWGDLVFLAGAQFNEAVLAGQWWRVLTATLLHDGIMHLAFNGYALYVLGPQLERGVGSAAFAALYLAAGLAGGMAFLVAAPHRIAVGASGAIFGLFGAYIAAAWSNRDTPAGRAGLSQLAVLLAINMALPVLFPQIAWAAHVGGLVIGIVVGLAWASRARRRRGAARASAAGQPSGMLVPPLIVAAALLAGLLWYT